MTRFIVPVLVIWGMTSCFFESSRPTEPIIGTYHTDPTVTLLDEVPAQGAADSLVNLYLPGLDPDLGAESEPPTHYAETKVLDHLTSKIVQYGLSTQRFRHWTATQEFQWNYFRLQTSFFFPKWLPDTIGISANTRELYARIGERDRFTRYIDSLGAEAERQKLLTTRTAAMGLRLELNSTGDTILVQQSIVSGPAYRSGIRDGMRILKVGEDSVTGDSGLVRFTELTQGDSGTAVKMTLLGSSGELSVVVVKEPVDFPSVMIDSVGSIPILSLFVFADSTVAGQSTAGEFREALRVLQNYPVFVLDLRHDPGGSLSQCLKVADELLGKDALIIRQEQRFFDEQYRVPLFGAVDQRATSNGIAIGRKVVLLADSGTASAAEILIASLRDNLKAPTVGTRTYGKGIGQVLLSTPGGGLAIITHLHFLAPLGEDYHGLGMKPLYPVVGGKSAMLAKSVEVAESLAGGSLALRGEVSGVAHEARELRRRRDLERIHANRVERLYLKAGAIEFE